MKSFIPEIPRDLKVCNAMVLTGMPDFRRVNFGMNGDLFRKLSQNDPRRCAPLSPTVNELSISSTMAEHLSREERLRLIHQNLQEVLKPDIIEHIVLKEDRPLKIYWGMEQLNRGLCRNR